MGLLILIVVGAILGWLATIMVRVEDSRGILTYAGIGVAGAVVAGFVAGSGLILGAVTAATLVWAVAGAAIALIAFTFARRRAFR